jgi:predicted RNA-binding Zn-ribbon protein involved in translation (DUF1610 family)
MYCGTGNGDVKFCENCGKPLEIAITAFSCPNCKEEIAYPLLYCPHCGAELKRVIPAFLRGTWICRGADSGKYDITRILTVDQMQTNFSDGRGWTGSVEEINFSFWAGDPKITVRVTEERGDFNIKAGSVFVQSLPLNNERNKFTWGNNVYIKQDADVVVPEELRGTWLRRGADSGLAFDMTRIITVNQMQTTCSDGHAWTGIIKSVHAARNPFAFIAGEYPSGWKITYSVTAAEGYDDIKVGQEQKHSFYLNAAKNAFTQHNDDFKHIFVKQQKTPIEESVESIDNNFKRELEKIIQVKV